MIDIRSPFARFRTSPLLRRRRKVAVVDVGHECFAIPQLSLMVVMAERLALGVVAAVPILRDLRGSDGTELALEAFACTSSGRGMTFDFADVVDVNQEFFDRFLLGDDGLLARIDAEGAGRTRLLNLSPELVNRMMPCLRYWVMERPLGFRSSLSLLVALTTPVPLPKR